VIRVVLSLVAGAFLGAVACGLIYATRAYIVTPSGGDFFGGKWNNAVIGLYVGMFTGFIPGAAIGLLTSLLGSGRATGVTMGLCVGAACLVYLFLTTDKWDKDLRVASLFFPPAGLLVGVLVSSLVNAAHSLAGLF
jgi:uncharacterized membrane protein YoaK (UPF0700 family)